MNEPTGCRHGGAPEKFVQYNSSVPAQPLQDIDARRQKLIQAWRLFPDGNFEKTIETADADDLAWLVERIDEQLKETPLWLKDPVPLAGSMADLRHRRIVGLADTWPQAHARQYSHTGSD